MYIVMLFACPVLGRIMYVYIVMLFSCVWKKHVRSDSMGIILCFQDLWLQRILYVTAVR